MNEWLKGTGGNGWSSGEDKSNWKWKAGVLGTVGVVAGGYLLKDKIMQMAADSLPVVANVGLGVAGTVGAVGLGLGGFKAAQAMKTVKTVAISIKPKEGMKVNPQKVGSMVKEFRQMYNKNFFRKRVWFRWQIIRDEKGQFSFQIICPEDHQDVVKTRFKIAYPYAVISVQEMAIPEFYHPDQGEAAHMRMKSWKKERGLRVSLDNVMGDVLSLMPDRSILEITFSPGSHESIEEQSKKAVKTLEERQKKGKDTTELINIIRERYQGNRTAFNVFIDVWSIHPLGAFLGELSAKTERFNKLRGKQYSLMKAKRNAFNWDSRIRSLPKWRSSLLTDKELSSFFMLPPPDHPVWEHIPVEFAKPPVKETDFKGHYAVGYIDSDDPAQDGRLARLKTKTFTNHGLIAGASGGGKGSALDMLIKLDFLDKWIEDKPDSMGMTICDPHAQGLYLVISQLLEKERQGIKIPWDRVKVVSFGKMGAYQYPVACNLLHMFEGDTVDQVASDTEEIILAAFDSSNLSQSVSNLQRAVQALLSSKKKHSILDIVRLFEHNKESNQMRAQLIDNITNPVVKESWRKIHDEIMKNKSDMRVGAIDTRLAPLVLKQSIQRFFCRDGNYFNVAEILKNGDLVLVDFLGAERECYKLVAGWLAKRYYDESQRRTGVKRPHLLIYDEVQKFDVKNIFIDIIKENRKFNMGLLLMTQQVEQLDRELADCITSNAGFVLSVRQEKGAQIMQGILGEPFTVKELRSLEKGLEACLRSDDGIARLKLEYPSFILEGETTWQDSTEEEEAKQIAREKFLELLARDHKPVDQADQEVLKFVYNNNVVELPSDQSEQTGSQEQKQQQAQGKKKRYQLN